MDTADYTKTSDHAYFTEKAVDYFESLGIFFEKLAGLEVLHLDDTNIAGARELAAIKKCPCLETITL